MTTELQTFLSVLTALNTLGIIAVLTVVFRAGKFAGDVLARLTALEHIVKKLCE